jgi:hypothetical protein
VTDFTATVTFRYSIDPDDPEAIHDTTDPAAMAAMHQAGWQDDPVALKVAMTHFGYKVTVTTASAA